MWLPFFADPFKYTNPLACIDVKLADQGLPLFVISVSIGKPKVEVSNAIPLILDLLETSDLDASLNPAVLVPGFLESLASA